MSRAEEFYGAGDVDKAFNGGPITPTPWAQAGMRKDRKHYDPEKVKAVLQNPDQHPMVAFDPRHLRSTQGSVTRAGVQHYMSGAEGLYGDKENAGNKRPVVYQRDDGQNIVLSGHHRAMKALLQGEQFHAVPVKGGWGPKR